MPSSQTRRSFLSTSLCAGGALAGLSGGVQSLIAAEPAKPSPSFAYDRERLAAGKKIPVIFDTDIGNDVDDTWALQYLLNSPELDVKLITAENNQADDRAKIVAKFLELAGRTDIPIGIGPNRQGTTNQHRWVADYSLDSYPGVIHENAAQAIVDTINTAPEPMTVVAVGPVPVVADAVKKDPFICGKSRFVGMHGSIYRGYGNSETPVAEYNVRADPAALRTVFEGDWECSITPLDTCGVLELNGDRYQKFVACENPCARAVMENYRIWLPEASWMKNKTMIETKSSILFDIVAVTMAFSEQWMQTETLPLNVDDKGMTVVAETDGRPVRSALRWRDFDGYVDHVLERLMAT